MGAPVVHFEIMGGEAGQLETFYGELFEWKINSNNPMKYGLVEPNGGVGINGGVGPESDGGKRVSNYPPLLWRICRTFPQLNLAGLLGRRSQLSIPPPSPH